MTKKRLELNDISRSTEDPNPGRTLPSLSASTAEPPHKTASPRKPEALATALEAMSQAWAVEKEAEAGQPESGVEGGPERMEDASSAKPKEPPAPVNLRGTEGRRHAVDQHRATVA